MVLGVYAPEFALFYGFSRNYWNFVFSAILSRLSSHLCSYVNIRKMGNFFFLDLPWMNLQLVLHSSPGGHLGLCQLCNLIKYESQNPSVFFFFAQGPSSEACLLPRTALPPAAALPRKGSIKSAATGVQVPSKPPPTSPLRLPKDCHRSLGDLKVGKPKKQSHFLFYFFKNNDPFTSAFRWLAVWWLAFCNAPNATCRPPPSMLGTWGRGRRGGGALRALPPTTCPWNKYDSEFLIKLIYPPPAPVPPARCLKFLPNHPQVLLTPWNTSRGHPTHHPHRRGHHHSHSDSRHNRHHGSRVPEGIHLRSCGDLSSSSSASLRRLVTPHPPHGSSGALYSESALWGGAENEGGTKEEKMEEMCDLIGQKEISFSSGV